jgi:hypothetical protein
MTDFTVAYDDTDTDIGNVRLEFASMLPIILDDCDAMELVYEIEKVLRKIQDNISNAA